MMFGRSGGKGSLSDLMSDGGVCRTAPATPGLLITVKGDAKVGLNCTEATIRWDIGG